MFEELDQIKGLLDQMKPFSSDLQQVLEEKLRIEWTYNSNAIEGNTLTLGETNFFLTHGLTVEGKPLKDYLEAENHAEAIHMLHDVVQKKREVTEGLIRELHALLLKGIDFTYAKGADGSLVKKPLISGEYKKRPNHVLTLSGEIHHYTDPIHVKDEMEKLINWLNQSKNRHSVERAALFHYRFVKIHPFDDGNGRLARLLMNLILMQDDYPICIIKNEHRMRYLTAIELSDATGDTSSFIEFIANELTTTIKMIRDILGNKSLNDLEKIRSKFSPKERHELILKALSDETLAIGQIEDRVNIKRPTLKKDLQSLVQSGKIERKGVGKGVVYYKP